METSAYQLAKLHVVQAVGLSKDALHVYAGLLIFLGVILVFRKPMRSVVPLIAVVVAAAIAEAFDARDDIASLGHWRVGASAHDVINTVFWPAVFFIVAKFKKALP